MNIIKQTLIVACCALMAVGAWAQSENAAETNGVNVGVYGGLGGQFPTGSLSDDFKSAIEFRLGLTGGYDRWRMKTDVSYSQPSLKNSNIFGRYQTVDNQIFAAQGNSHADASRLGWSLQVGYNVFNEGRLAITPNVGLGYSRYSWDVDNLQWSLQDGDYKYTVTGTDGVHVNDFSWIVSIDFDYRLHRTVTGAFGGDKFYSSSVRVTPYLTYAKYDKCNPTVKGCVLGITVNYLGLLSWFNK